MSKFKIGDTVERTGHNVGRKVMKGCRYTVSRIAEEIDVIGLVGLGGIYHEENFRLVKPVWTPKKGDMILVWDDVGGFSFPKPARFVCMDGDKFVTQESKENIYLPWDNASPMPAKHTITFEDGTTTTVSQEQYDELRGQK